MKKLEFKPNYTYYNRDVVKCPVYGAKCGRGMIYVQDADSFTYTFSFGRNSDYSFTGSFYKMSKIKTVEQAMHALSMIAYLWLSDDTAGLQTFKNNLK